MRAPEALVKHIFIQSYARYLHTSRAVGRQQDVPGGKRDAQFGDIEYRKM